MSSPTHEARTFGAVVARLRRSVGFIFRSDMQMRARGTLGKWLRRGSQVRGVGSSRRGARPAEHAGSGERGGLPCARRRALRAAPSRTRRTSGTLAVREAAVVRSEPPGLVQHFRARRFPLKVPLMSTWKKKKKK